MSTLDAAGNGDPIRDAIDAAEGVLRDPLSDLQISNSEVSYRSRPCRWRRPDGSPVELPAHRQGCL